MRLYMLEGCPFAHRAVISLREKGLPFETVFFRAGHRPPELEAVGPRAKSPTLFDGDARVYDSQAVLEYLEERTPEPALLPPTPLGRAEVRMLLARVSDELASKQYAVVGELVKPEPDQAKLETARKELRGTFEAWNRHFEGRTWAVGDALSLADLALYSLLAGAARPGGIEIGSEHAALRGWFDRMAARATTEIPRPEPVA